VPGRRGKRACRRRTDRGHDAAACRSRCGRLDRRPHRAFFSAALKGENDGQRVTEDAPDRGLGNEAGEAVDVQEALAFWHPRIVTSFPRHRKAKFAWKTRKKSASVIKSYPHDFTKSPNSISEEDYSRLEALCMLFGIGLVLFETNLEEPDFKIRVRAQRFPPDMFYVNEFAERIYQIDAATFNQLFG
jgi:hypothetical protein